MKWTILQIVLVAVLAGLLSFSQRFVCFAGDDFSLVLHEGGSYKVFTYGFPFQVKEANPILAIATPPGQIVIKMLGNFAMFFLTGLAVLAVMKVSRIIMARCLLVTAPKLTSE